ncbi:uncharacterized protein LOC116350190, partial [Contarinia nasturtii]
MIEQMRSEDENAFKGMFRMNGVQFDFLLEKVRPLITKKDTNMRKSISAETRLMITLKYLSSGDSYRTLMYLFRVPHNTISGIIPSTCKAIFSSLREEYLKVPNTCEEWKKIADDFQSKWNFPNCLGALDGKHIVLRCPKNSGSLNFNYKHNFSIVLMALVDANYKFTYIDVGCKGRISDGGVFNRSSLYHAIENNLLNIPSPYCLPGTTIETPYVIVADDAFALKSYIMKPFNFRNQDKSQQVFNYRLSRARRMVESAFGIMAARFRLLRTNIEISENNVKLCVLAICVLHNFLVSDEDEILLSDALLNFNETCENESTNPINYSNEAKEIRELFKSYFVSPAGE